MVEDYILPLFVRFAYEPMWVYLTITLIMIASSFGLPVPEEVTLISAGLVCYMAAHSTPPYPNAQSVNLITTAIVSFLAVFLSDYFIFMLGRHFGGYLLKKRFLQRYTERLHTISYWIKKYGHWAAGIFRFTPGIRFPGHFTIGMMGLSSIRFILVDGTAALISVPTQVILVAHYGGIIIENLKRFQTMLIGAAIVIGIFYFLQVYRKEKRLAQQANGDIKQLLPPME